MTLVIPPLVVVVPVVVALEMESVAPAVPVGTGWPICEEVSVEM